MHNITFDLSRLHLYGPAFYNYLKLRKHFFVDTLGWDIPHDDQVEMDQYDNPRAHYSLVMQNGQVVGGARCMPTSTRWGKHSYMLKDARDGKLEDIPAAVMPSDVVSDRVWECTRLVVSDELTSHAARSECLSLIVDGLVRTANLHGAAELMSLSPVSLMRALRQLGYDAWRVGEPYRNEGDGRNYAVLAMSAQPVMGLMAAE